MKGSKTFVNVNEVGFVPLNPQKIHASLINRFIKFQILIQNQRQNQTRTLAWLLRLYTRRLENQFKMISSDPKPHSPSFNNSLLMDWIQLTRRNSLEIRNLKSLTRMEVQCCPTLIFFSFVAVQRNFYVFGVLDFFIIAYVYCTRDSLDLLSAFFNSFFSLPHISSLFLLVHRPNLESHF